MLAATIAGGAGVRRVRPAAVAARRFVGCSRVALPRAWSAQRSRASGPPARWCGHDSSSASPAPTLHRLARSSVHAAGRRLGIAGASGRRSPPTDGLGSTASRPPSGPTGRSLGSTQRARLMPRPRAPPAHCRVHATSPAAGPASSARSRPDPLVSARRPSAAPARAPPPAGRRLASRRQRRRGVGGRRGAPAARRHHDPPVGSGPSPRHLGGRVKRSRSTYRRRALSLGGIVAEQQLARAHLRLESAWPLRPTVGDPSSAPASPSPSSLVQQLRSDSTAPTSRHGSGDDALRRAPVARADRRRPRAPPSTASPRPARRSDSGIERLAG